MELNASRKLGELAISRSPERVAGRHQITGQTVDRARLHRNFRTSGFFFEQTGNFGTPNFIKKLQPGQWMRGN
jgi:hypothetical protein